MKEISITLLLMFTLCEIASVKVLKIDPQLNVRKIRQNDAARKAAPSWRAGHALGQPRRGARANAVNNFYRDEVFKHTLPLNTESTEN